jgi:hypothetical protein
MTRYRWEATVPPQTGQADAVESVIEIEERDLLDGFIFAPPGSAGRVKGEILWGERVLLPSADSSRTLLPATTDPAPIDLVIRGSPYELTLRAWAPAATQTHTVTARVDAQAASTPVRDVRIVGSGPPSSERRETPTPEDIMSAGGDE